MSDARLGSAPDGFQPEQFGAEFLQFLQWIHTVGGSQRNEVAAFVRDFLGEDGCATSVVGRDLSPFEQVNLQTALNVWAAADGRGVSIDGIALPPHFGGVFLQQLINGEALPPLRLSAPALVDLPNGPESTLACLKLALLRVTDQRGTYLMLLSGPGEHDPSLRLEVAGLPVAVAQEVLAALDALRSEHNVYRGQLLEIVPSPMGGVQLHFAHLPRTLRSEVILPEAVLARVERHALGIAEHRASLLAAGQHLKRGLLLFGPPGTGKTHTTRYLLNEMQGYTRLMLSGRSLHMIGAVTGLARELAPAVVVLEDVDLVAEDRSFGPGGNPVLFDLLDAMDGAAPDADLLFLLTTNRADLLEPALAARPGRVDVAVEIERPDVAGRGSLLRLYGRPVGLDLTEAEFGEVVERTAWVTASFLKELVRRAALESLARRGVAGPLTIEDMGAALDDLLDTSQQITRSLLGHPDHELDPVTHQGFASYGPVPGMQPGRPMPMRYSSRLHIRPD